MSIHLLQISMVLKYYNINNGILFIDTNLLVFFFYKLQFFKKSKFSM